MEPITDKYTTDLYRECINLRHQLNHAHRREVEAWAALIVVAAVAIVTLMVVT